MTNEAIVIDIENISVGPKEENIIELVLGLKPYGQYQRGQHFLLSRSLLNLFRPSQSS